MLIYGSWSFPNAFRSRATDREEFWSKFKASTHRERVSIDFLVSKTSLEVDKQTLQRLEGIQNLPEKDKEYIFYTLDNLIKAAKFKAIQ